MWVWIALGTGTPQLRSGQHSRTGIWEALLVHRYLCTGGGFVLCVFLRVPRLMIMTYVLARATTTCIMKHHFVKKGPVHK